MYKGLYAVLVYLVHFLLTVSEIPFVLLLLSAQAWAAYYQQYYAQAAAANQAGANPQGELCMMLVLVLLCMGVIRGES